MRRHAAATVTVAAVMLFAAACTTAGVASPATVTATTTATVRATTTVEATTTARASTVHATTTVTATVTITANPTFGGGSDLTGTKILDNASVEGPDGIIKVLTATGTNGYGLTNVTDVHCPTMPVVVDNTYDCLVEISGQTKTVTITIKTLDGQYEVGAPH